MKNQCSFLITFLLSFHLSANLPPGSVAPDFTLTDLNGNVHTLSNYTSAGKTVVIVVFATWNPADWDYYNTGTLQNTWEIHGPDGDDTVVVLLIEGDTSTDEESIYGIGDEFVQGDYTQGVTYPIFDDPSGVMMNDYEVTLNSATFVVCPSGIIVNSSLVSPPLAQIEERIADCETEFLPNDPSLTFVYYPLVDFCEGLIINPSVHMRNLGTNNLTSCQITFSGGVQEFVHEWTGNIEPFGIETVDVFGVTVTDGVELIATITSPDDDPSDNITSLHLPANVNGTSHFRFHLLTDHMPEETTWALRKDGVIILDGGPYQESHTLYEQDFYVDDLGCYEFVVYDSYQNGLLGNPWGAEPGFLKLMLIDELGNIVSEGMNYDGTYNYADIHGHIHVTEIVPVTISGFVFEDLDEDGYQDDTENGIGNVEVHLDDMVTFTNDNGAYSFVEPVNPENLSIVYDNVNWPSNTTPISLTIDPVNDASHNFGLTSDNLNYDVSFTYSEPWMYFCQMESSIGLNISNNGNHILDEVIVTMSVDPLLTIFSTSPEAIVNGNTVVWTFNDVTLGNIEYLVAHVMVPSFEYMGSDIVNSVLLQAYQNEEVVDEDSQSYLDILDCSYDPNDKQVSPFGETAAHYIMNGTDLEYYIRFQNTGTAPAFNININDILDSDLDFSTFQVVATSHYCQPSINTETGEVNFYFPDILLPDSVFDEPGSHGFIRYRISLSPDLAEGTMIENTAYIYFDFNPAVVTNTTWNTVSDLYFSIEEHDEQPLWIYPNPANDSFTVYNGGIDTYNSLLIFDLRGNLIRSENILLSSGHQIRLATQGLSDGLYILDLRGDNNSAKSILNVSQ